MQWIFAGMLMMGLAVLLTWVPHSKATVAVDEAGITVESVGMTPFTRRRATWAEIDSIEIGAGMRNSRTFAVRFRPSKRRSHYLATNVQLGVKPLAIVEEIAARASAGGYRLDGSAFQEPFIGNRSWRLVPASD